MVRVYNLFFNLNFITLLKKKNRLSLCHLLKMSASSKLIIHKFEAAKINFKSLHVSIDCEDNSTSNTKYSDWFDGKLEIKKKDNPKSSSRLVVKIVSGNDFDRFNLVAIAKDIDAPETYVANILAKSTEYEVTHKLDVKVQDANYDREEKPKGLLNQPTIKNKICSENDISLQLYVKNKCKLNNTETFSNTETFNNTETFLSPLEQSLEKVKENNARIMENIQMLNRTLNYTKKKEILDILRPKSARSFPCSTCGKCFVYETGLRRHCSMRHSMTKVPPRWQVVWTCIQCFQVYPCQEQAMKHSNECCNSNNTDSVREIKTSSLLQCEFCEKVYTSIPRLLRHSKTHTTANNYECNACGLAFTSYKAAEQHWILCPWMNMYYSFSLPKHLLCNACDRKFRNYEQLYNHRYKVGHFMTKTHGTHVANVVNAVVYQCELCGKWYGSVATLKAHKNKCHPKHDLGMQCGLQDTPFANSQNNIMLKEELCIQNGETVKSEEKQ